MTSEELEISLRTEFENHLNNTLASIRQDVAEFQKNFDAEFAKHRSQMDEAIRVLNEKLGGTPQLDKGFAESVVEHLRLARDEGAQITATAFGEAEKLRTESASEARYDVLRNAINDISSQGTQAAILKSLVEHASEFAPRGAFFILKNDQFVGWKVFGAAGGKTDADAQAVRFSSGDPTLLALAVDSLATAEGAHGSFDEDAKFLEPLDFGRPDRMYAIPLTARGRGVAVLYADYGTEGVALNIEALETLVRVAGLTVELRAAVPAASHVEAPKPAEPAYSPAEEPAQEPAQESEPYTYEPEQQSWQPEPSPEAAAETHSYQPDPPESYASFSDHQAEPAQEPVMAEPSPFESPVGDPVSGEQEYTGAVVYEEQEAVESVEYHYDEPVVAEESVQESVEYGFEPTLHDAAAEPISEAAPVEQEYAFESTSAQPVIEEAESVPETVEHSAVETSFSTETASDTASPFSQPVEAEAVVEEPVQQSEPAPGYTNGKPAEAQEQPAVEAVGGTQLKGRFGDRMLDLPIDVPEEERKLHNNARRFARLLVSEIKLYNEQKVVEGREAGDLYDRLREAIDRSREMYDKRVETHVADKFDYFHYELVNSLADGDGGKLGANYQVRSN